MLATKRHKKHKKVVHLGACPRGNHDRADSPKQLSLGQRPRKHNKYSILPLTAVSFIRCWMLNSTCWTSKNGVMDNYPVLKTYNK